jgi:hypothetical protein
MSLDPITDSIAHFIGHFHLVVEEGRLRKDYHEFKAAERKADDAAWAAFAPVRFDAEHKLGDFDPGLRALPASADPMLPIFVGAPFTPMLPEGLVPRLDLGDLGPDGSVPPGLDWGNGVRLPYAPPPSSLAAVTLQSLTLYDNDVLGDAQAAGFTDPIVYEALLMQAIEIAEAMTPWSLDGLTWEVIADPSAAVAFFESLEEVVIPQVDGAVAVLLRGEDALGPIVDGEVLGEDEVLPTRDELLPAFLAKKHGVEVNPDDEAEGEDAPPPQIVDARADNAILFLHERDLKDLAEQGDRLPGHEATHSVMAGGNELTNEAVIYTNWIDAPVIAVAGDVVTLDAVSQVNLLFDRDGAEGQALPGLATSKAINAAGISTVESTLIRPAEVGGSILPAVWNVKTVSGDVLLANHVQQHSFVMDADRLDITFTADSTTLVAGENQLFNLLAANEFGFGYDLILIGGSMVTMNLVQQTNVLLDDDTFTGPALSGALLSGDDNLALNKAEILKEGIDQHVEMAQAFADALRDMAQGAKDLATDVAQNELFTGFETLRALYIEGNLTQINLIDQVNYLGDQDQVRLAADALAEVLQGVGVTIATGSNALANLATIKTAGLDSTIMAQGAVYEDAVLYQAGLIDTDAPPAGVTLSALASEAVAFLADDMLGSDIAKALEGAGAVDDSSSVGTPLDVMQTMTA